eukprot:jgi/Tetstr1/449219/TSEL_036425.t1
MPHVLLTRKEYPPTAAETMAGAGVPQRPLQARTACEWRSKQQPARRSIRAVLCLILMLLHGSAGVHAQDSARTSSTDAAILVAFKDFYNAEYASMSGGGAQDLFESWLGFDPCVEQWAGVQCEVSAEDPAVLRVTGLNVTGRANSYLQGPLFGGISSLDKLNVLDVSNNKLSGHVPAEYNQLLNLAELRVQGNMISGLLPSFIVQLRIRSANLAGNQFYGQLPQAWCGRNFTVDVQDNAQLCGEVPTCATGAPYASLVGLSGTGIGQTSPETCDISPPACGDACHVRVFDYIMGKTNVPYSFQGFQDAESGVERYEVALSRFEHYQDYGTADVVSFYPFDGDITTYVGSDLIEFNGTVVLLGSQLVEGERYVVLIRATNGWGLSTTKASNPTLVTVWSPVPGYVFNGGDCKNHEYTTEVDSLTACWVGFIDRVVGIEGFQVKIVNHNSTHVHSEQWFPESAQNTSVSISAGGWPLTVGELYRVRVVAVNKAGRSSGPGDSAPIRVVAAQDPTNIIGGTVGLTIAVSVVLVLLLSAIAAASYFMYKRVVLRKKVQRRAREHQAMVKALMSSLEQADGDDALTGNKIRKCRELAFVTTDLLDSTKMAAASVEGFQQVQDIHDQIMREGISRHSGYEINTEGDAFQVAFQDVFQAVKFCMDVQYKLLEVPWTRKVLRLPSCKEVISPDGELLYKGPRVRMGIHWAKKGTVNHRLHPLTKHRIFAGPSWRVAGELGDAANGGQVLMTHETWCILRTNMAKANYPVVEQVGLFKFDAITTPMWVYEVKEFLCQPLHRSFPLPRGIQHVDSGFALNIMTPPRQPGDGGSLSVVAIVLKPPDDVNHLDLPQAMAQHLYEQLAIQAMQFRGYIFRVNKKRGYFLVAFSSTMDAVRFCHAFQLMLMFIHWPAEGESFCGAQVIGPDGRYVFNGPRLAMAVNEEPAYNAVKLFNHHPYRDDAIDYTGPCVDHAKELSCIVHGGQVVLTQHAWIAVQDHLPGQAEALSIGVHRVSAGMPQPMLLMQVMPGILSRRVFSPCSTLKQIEAGYLSSPDPSKDMAIVFVKVAKPAIVSMNERKILHNKADAKQMGSSSGQDMDYAMFLNDENDDETKLLELDYNTPLPARSASERQNYAILKAYAKGIKMYEEALRSTLQRFNGYECKEPDPGKFTLAFSMLEEAVMWGTTLQEELLKLPWPPELLEIEECSPQYADIIDDVGDRSSNGMPIRALKSSMYALPQGGDDLEVARSHVSVSKGSASMTAKMGSAGNSESGSGSKWNLGLAQSLRTATQESAAVLEYESSLGVARSRDPVTFGSNSRTNSDAAQMRGKLGSPQPLRTATQEYAAVLEDQGSRGVARSKGSVTFGSKSRSSSGSAATNRNTESTQPLQTATQESAAVLEDESSHGVARSRGSATLGSRGSTAPSLGSPRRVPTDVPAHRLPSVQLSAADLEDESSPEVSRSRGSLTLGSRPSPSPSPLVSGDLPSLRSLAEIQPSAQAVQTSEIELQEVDGTEGSRSGKQAQPIVSSHPSETSDMPFNVLREKSVSVPEIMPPKQRLIFRGLRVQMGCAYGRVASRKPLNTGRADYFGNLPNTAARVMSLANPGQFLIEGSIELPTPLFREQNGSATTIEDNKVLLKYIPRPTAQSRSIASESSQEGPAPRVKRLMSQFHRRSRDSDEGTPHFFGPLERKEAVVSQFGYFMLKGLDEPKLILQAATPDLAQRVFLPGKGEASAPSNAASSKSSNFLLDAFKDQSTRGARKAGNVRRNESWLAKDTDGLSPNNSFQGFANLFRSDEGRSSRGFKLGGSTHGAAQRGAQALTQSMHGAVMRQTPGKGILAGSEISDTSRPSTSGSHKLSVSFGTTEGGSSFSRATDSGSAATQAPPAGRLRHRRSSLEIVAGHSGSNGHSAPLANIERRGSGPLEDVMEDTSYKNVQVPKPTSIGGLKIAQPIGKGDALPGQ